MSEKTITQDEVKYVAQLVERARIAQKIAESYPQERVDELVMAIAWSTVKKDVARELAQMAYDESKMGNVETKFMKFRNKVPCVLDELKRQKSVGLIEEIPEKGLRKYAKPVGVVGALIPSTQPEMTPVVKAMFGLKARNAVLFSPHPRTRNTTLKVVDYMRAALKERDAPPDLLICAENPSIPMSQEIMKRCDLVVATGGAGMVRAAYSSGTPAYGVGVGNDVAIVDETADIKDAAQKIFISKNFDYASGCSCENAIVIHESVYDAMVAELKALGSYMCSAEEKARLRKVMWPEPGKLNMKIITQPASLIAGLAELPIPENCQVIMVEESGSGGDFPFSGEKLSVVIAVYKYSGGIEKAIEILNANQAYQGAGHSCSIHSRNQENIRQVSLKTYTTRVMVCQGTNTGNSGTWTNGMPRTVVLGCGTWGGNIASENIVLKHFYNTTWVSEPLNVPVPGLKEVFGEFMDEE